MSFELQKINRHFEVDGINHHVLEEVDLQVKKGEFLCLMGPSGCGKSTLLRIMAGLLEPSSGEIMEQPQRIGFVFQNFGLMPWLTVEQNIAFGLKMDNEGPQYTAKTVDQRVRQLGLTGLGQRHPKELSGGQKQRVGIARALAINPDILMLDEPFSALDAFTAEELREDVLKIWKESGTTVVMVTHLAEEAAEMADRIIVFSPRPGRIISEIKNQLPRLRDARSPQFFKLVDRLEELIRPH